MCFFIVYLLKIITNIIKANTIIVSTINANKSKYIISNKITSIIAPPPFSQYKLWIKVATTSAIFISYIGKYTIYFKRNQAYFTKKQKYKNMKKSRKLLTSYIKLEYNRKRRKNKENPTY